MRFCPRRNAANSRRSPGDPQSVTQTHSRRATVIMADGKRCQATELGIDDVIKFLREIAKDVPIAAA